jgi:hypothetical protein
MAKDVDRAREGHFNKRLTKIAKAKRRCVATSLKAR